MEKEQPPLTLEEIRNKIADLEQQANAIEKASFDSALAEVKEKIAAFGFTAADLGLGLGQKARKTFKVHAKYKKGRMSWSGRGRKPQFIQEHLAAGGSLDDLLISKSKDKN